MSELAWAWRWTRLFALVLAFMCSAPSRAQGPRLSEAQVVRALQKQDPRFEKLRAQLRRAKAQLELSSPRWSPQLYYQLQQVGSAAQLEREQEIGGGATLVAPHQRGAQEQARLAVDRQRFSAQRESHELVIAGLRRFYQIITYQERLRILRAWKEGLDELLRVASARVRAGEAPGYEKLRVELSLRRAKSEIRVAESLHSTEARSFSRFLGLGGAPAHFDGRLLPDEGELRTALENLEERASLATLREASRGQRRHAWLPALSLNAGLRMRSEQQSRHWGFGLGVSGAFPSFKRVKALRSAAQANRHALDAQVRARGSFDQQEKLRWGGLCMALLQEHHRYGKEMRDVLDPLSSALKAEYQEGKRDVVGLMSVLESSMESERYRLDLALRARNAELEFRNAQGAFER